MPTLSIKTYLDQHVSPQSVLPWGTNFLQTIDFGLYIYIVSLGTRLLYSTVTYLSAELARIKAPYSPWGLILFSGLKAGGFSYWICGCWFNVVF